MVDPQLDATWRRMIGFEGDAFSITSTEFVTAGPAWQAWRRGDIDAGRFGLSAVNEHGPHWIAGNLRLDLASMNKVEMLPWDVWGSGWRPGEQPTEAQLRLFDAVAELTVDPDARPLGREFSNLLGGGDAEEGRLIEHRMRNARIAPIKDGRGAPVAAHVAGKARRSLFDESLNR